MGYLSIIICLADRGNEWIFLKRNPISIFAIFKVGFMVFNTTFNNISVISWWSVLLVEETRVPGENHRHVASHWLTLSHNVASSTPLHERGSNFCGDRHWLHPTAIRLRKLRPHPNVNWNVITHITPDYLTTFSCLVVCLFDCLSFLFAFVHFEVLCNS